MKDLQLPETFEKWAELIDLTDLDEIQKQAIKTRIISVVMRLRSRLRRLSVAFTCLKTSTTVGSLLVPSILTLQSPNQTQTNTPVSNETAYWIIWGIGLIVGISNAFVSLFRVDKNYYTVGNLLEKIESESWLFLTQSGPYQTQDEERSHIVKSGHKSHFSDFIVKCEILINKAIRSEYSSGFKHSGTVITGGASTHEEILSSSKKETKDIPVNEIKKLYKPVNVDDKGEYSTSDNRNYRSITSFGGISSNHIPELPQTPPERRDDKQEEP